MALDSAGHELQKYPFCFYEFSFMVEKRERFLSVTWDNAKQE
jgi:hypothetical protein